MADAARDRAVLIFARELFGIGAGLGMRRAIGIAFQRDRRHGDDRRLGKLLFKSVIVLLALGEAEAPAIIVYHDRDMVRVVESGSAPRKGRVIEIPFRRGELP